MPDLTPDDVARREFRTGFRGYETTEVRSFLSEVAAGLASLLDDQRRLTAPENRPGDVRAEIEAVMSEVGAVLEAAQEAAASMRERASGDATRWRSEAVAEAEAERSRAAVEAEALRSDAWTMSEQLLSQCQAESERVVAEAKKEALRVLGEAEREAHRMQAASRREAEDVVRAARMEAERLSATAKARHDEMIDEAMKQSESAQERTLALEKRRHELLGELESVRATLTQVEDALDQRRERLGLSPSTEAVGKVVTKDTPPPPPAPPGERAPDGTWTPGETVRVVRPSRPGEAAGATEITSQPPQPKVRILSGRQFARIKAGLDPEEPDDEVEEAEDAGNAVVEFDEPEELLVQREDASTTVKLVESEAPRRSGDTDHGNGEPEPEPDRPTDGDVHQPMDGDQHDPAASGDEVDEHATAVPEQPAVERSDTEPPAERGTEPAPDPEDANPEADAEEVAEGVPSEVAEPAAEEPAAQVVSEDPPVVQERAAMTHEPEQPEAAEAEETPSSDLVAEDDLTEGEDDQQQLFNDVTGLFDRLRVDIPGAAPRAPDQIPDEVESMVTRRLSPAVVDPFEVRDRLLLPVGNRALRNLKRQLTEAQNVALEEIRLDESGWEPSAEAVRDRVRADLVVLFAESFGAGHTAAEEMLGGRVPRPGTPRDEVAEEFVATLTHELTQVVHEGRAAGQGARQLGASLSRVFRGWRTDQAERRVRDLSLGAYHQGLVRSLELGEVTDLGWKVAGRGCATCRAAGESRPPGLVPPAHPGCECTLAP